MYRGSSHSSPFSPLPRLSPVILLQAWKHFIPPLIFHHALHSCLNFHFLSLTHTHTHACITVLMNFSLCQVLSSFCVCVCVFVIQSCPTLCDPWTVPQQAPLSIEFSRQEYWSGQLFPSLGDLPGTPLQYSCLENPMDGGAWQAADHGVAKSRTELSDFTFTFHFHALEKEMATHSSVLAWRIPGTGEPGRLLSMGSHRVGHD